jgi:hypothetical protein
MTLSEIETQWAAEYPGTTLLIVLLRTTLALADWHARQIQAQFQQLHHDLFQTGLPMAFWDPFTHRTYHLLQRHHSRAQREFRHALSALQSSYKKPEPVKPPPPEPPPPPKGTFNQTFLIATDENGNVKTTADADAAFMLALPPEALETIGWFTRSYHFPDCIVPDCYAHLLTHNGFKSQPKLALLITYAKDDFLRLCRQEIETASPIPLEDPACRLKYGWTD